MKTKQVLILALLAFCTLHSSLSTAKAQGTAFSYEGQLQTNGPPPGPANGNYDFEFSLYPNAAGTGAPLGMGMITQLAIGVTNGLFNTSLDFGDVFAGNATWLAISVRSNGVVPPATYTALTPLQELLPTPYAIFANTASSVSGPLSTSVLPNFQAPNFNTVGGGFANIVDGPYGTVGGGFSNNATGIGAFIGGGGYNGLFGLGNNASGTDSVIGGGYGNTNSGQDATVGGGFGNVASQNYATVGGGVHNTASGQWATVSGGNFNTASGSLATVGGGGAFGPGSLLTGNTASGQYSTVSGGSQNQATNLYATVPGGVKNLAGGQWSLAAGYSAQATNDGSFVWSDGSSSTPFASSNNNSFNVRATGGLNFVTAGAGVTLDGNALMSGSHQFTPPGNGYPILNMVWIVPGTFVMGAPTSDPDYQSDETQHVVALTNGFWMGQHPVTQGEYLAVMGNNPSSFTGDLSRPVEQVTWFNAGTFCTNLTQNEQSAGRLPSGWVYRLPTESEWEYCCRALTTSRYYFGNDPGDGTSLTNYAWYTVNSGGTTQPVGQLLPNAWGLVDMTGNVFEWCQDWYGTYPTANVSYNPQGPASGSYRVLRGGSWYDPAYFCRSADRGSGSYPTDEESFYGFRVVLAPGQ